MYHICRGNMLFRSKDPSSEQNFLQNYIHMTCHSHECILQSTKHFNHIGWLLWNTVLHKSFFSSCISTNLIPTPFEKLPCHYIIALQSTIVSHFACKLFNFIVLESAFLSSALLNVLSNLPFCLDLLSIWGWPKMSPYMWTNLTFITSL